MRPEGTGQTLPQAPLPEFSGRNGRLQPLLRLPHHAQRGEETDHRQPGAGCAAVGHHQLRAALRLCRRKVRERTAGRPQQHQTLHGNRTDSLIHRQSLRGIAGTALRRRGSLHDGPVRRLRRPMGHQRLEPVDGRRPGDHRAVEVVSPQKARHLLRIFQRQPQPG